MRVLGIDPGTLRMGYGLIEEKESVIPLEWGVLAVARSLALEQRLYQIYSSLLDLIRLWRPDEIAVEEPFVGKAQKQYIGPSFAIGQAQAIVLIAAAGEGLPVFRYSPAQVKKAIVNYGGANKKQMQEVVMILLGMDTLPSPSDAADALAIALCHLWQREVEGILAREIKRGV